jgi:hypothetical protein
MRPGLVVVVVLAALSSAARADRVRVAVIPGTAVNLDVARVDALAQDLADALRGELEVDAIGGVDVRRRLPEHLPADCVANQACITDVAIRLGVQQLLFVVMIDTGASGAIQVDTTWVDAAEHRTASRPTINIAAISEARARFAADASQLLPGAPVRPKPRAGVGRMSSAVPRHLALPSYVAAGATAVGLGVGIGFGLDARGKYRDCDDLAGRGAPCSSARKDSIRRVALIADAGWLVAIGGTIAAAVLYATSGEASHVIVEPTPGGAAVTAVGSF